MYRVCIETQIDYIFSLFLFKYTQNNYKNITKIIKNNLKLLPINKVPYTQILKIIMIHNVYLLLIS